MAAIAFKEVGFQAETLEAPRDLNSMAFVSALLRFLRTGIVFSNKKADVPLAPGELLKLPFLMLHFSPVSGGCGCSPLPGTYIGAIVTEITMADLHIICSPDGDTMALVKFLTVEVFQ